MISLSTKQHHRPTHFLLSHPNPFSPGVYHTVRMAHLKALLKGLELDFAEVEQIIVAAIKERQIKVCPYICMCVCV